MRAAPSSGLPPSGLKPASASRRRSVFTARRGLSRLRRLRPISRTRSACSWRRRFKGEAGAIGALCRTLDAALGDVILGLVPGICRRLVTSLGCRCQGQARA
ncbi:hypothetical protein AGR1B_Cc40125 [Agrobacterium fabacearum S56]|nr:hypothetical protein AGR1B_Cc40125 [Agrobacterium fabacearum S56]